VGEEHAFLGDTIEGRRARVRIAEDAGIRRAPIIAEDEEDVRAIRGGESECGEQEQAEGGGESSEDFTDVRCGGFI
jgi:hypothetical protein